VERELIALARLADEVEAQALADALDAEGIPHVVQPFSASQYPFVRSGRGEWGEIRVGAQHLERARQVLSEWRSSPAVDEDDLAQQALGGAPPPAQRDDGPPGAGWPGGLALAASIVLNLVLGFMVWSAHAEIEIDRYHDRDRRLVSEIVYDEGAPYPREMRTFARDRRHVETLYDRDLDGRWDEAISHPPDQDPADAASTPVQPIRWLDTNGDGLFDRAERGPEGRYGVMEDRDADGWYERVTCRPEPSQELRDPPPRVFDTVRCTFVD
jgi:hypothetical protein